MGNLSILDDVPPIIRETLLNPKISEDFEIACMEILTDSTLAKILGQGENELPKVAYAKIILSREVYDIIGAKWIINPNMTFEKICTIGVGDPETENLLDGGLSIDLIRAMTGKFLAHPGMTVDKITLLQFGATADMISSRGAQEIAEMNEDDLNMLIFC